MNSMISTIKELENYPKKDIELKNRIRANCYDILEMAYEANSIREIEDKRKLIYKVISKAKIIDFLLNLSFDKKLITEKKYYKFGLKLNDIMKYLSGWLEKLSGA